MTDIKLLPLPEKEQLANPYLSRGATAYGHTDETLQAYARACVSSATEALRAEVEKWKVPCLEWLDKTEWVQQTVKPRELGHHRADILRERIQRSEARAERLAEALRELADAADYALRTRDDSGALSDTAEHNLRGALADYAALANAAQPGETG